MKQVLEAISGTPWWVFILFIFLVLRGIRNLKPQIISVKKIFVIPLIFFVWSIWRLVVNYQGFMDLAIWLFFLILGYIIGWGISISVKIRADRKKLLIRIPGSPMLLIVILLIFSFRYLLGYYSAIHPEVKNNLLFHTAQISLSLFTGFFVGRVFCILKKFAKAKHVKLKETK